MWIISLQAAGVVLSRCGLEGQDGALDDVDAFVQLVLVDDEGGSQADDVTVGGLGQESVVTETQAHLPRVVVFGLFDDDCVKEAFPSDCCHDVFG